MGGWPIDASRIRAELQGGLLYKKSVKANGGTPSRRSRSHAATEPKTLEELGISKTQSSRWQQLAENPGAVEKYLRDTEDVPTTAGALAEQGKQTRPSGVV